METAHCCGGEGVNWKRWAEEQPPVGVYVWAYGPNGAWVVFRGKSGVAYDKGSMLGVPVTHWAEIEPIEMEE